MAMDGQTTPLPGVPLIEPQVVTDRHGPDRHGREPATAT